MPTTTGPQRARKAKQVTLTILGFLAALVGSILLYTFYPGALPF